MRILAIDPGSRCGWALYDTVTKEFLVSGVWDLTPPRGCSPGVRYLKLRSRLVEVLDAFPGIGVVAVEAAHHRGGAATEYAVGVVTHCQAWAAEHGVEVLQIRSTTVKRVATGRGNASKDEMIDAAEAMWKGVKFHSDDEVDARWIAMAAAEEVGK